MSVQGQATPLRHLASLAGKAVASLAGPLTWPMWGLATLACVPRFRGRAAVSALAVLPAAAALPGAVSLARGDHFSFGVFAPAWLTLFVLGAAVPVIAAVARREPGTDAVGRLLVSAAPASLVGAATVAWVTNASWNRAVIVVPLAAVGLGVLVGWGILLRREGGERTLLAGGALTLGITAALLTATVWAEFQGPAEARVDHGAYAGIVVTARRSAQLGQLESAGRRYVGPEETVLFVGEPEGYLLVGGRIDTPAVWLVPGPGDGAILAGLRARGAMPDVVFVDGTGVEQLGGWRRASAVDPLIARVTSEYDRVGQAAGFTIYRRRQRS